MYCWKVVSCEEAADDASVTSEVFRRRRDRKLLGLGLTVSTSLVASAPNNPPSNCASTDSSSSRERTESEVAASSWHHPRSNDSAVWPAEDVLFRPNPNTDLDCFFGRSFSRIPSGTALGSVMMVKVAFLEWFVGRFPPGWFVCLLFRAKREHLSSHSRIPEGYMPQSGQFSC